MANETSGAYFTANAVVDKTAAGTFIPEIWSDEVIAAYQKNQTHPTCLLYTSPSPRDRTRSRMPSSA